MDPTLEDYGDTFANVSYPVYMTTGDAPPSYADDLSNKTRREMLEEGVLSILDGWRYQVSEVSRRP